MSPSFHAITAYFARLPRRRKFLLATFLFALIMSCGVFAASLFLPEQTLAAGLATAASATQTAVPTAIPPMATAEPAAPAPAPVVPAPPPPATTAPLLGVIWVPEGLGAYLYPVPGSGPLLSFLDNGALLTVHGETQEAQGLTWERVTAGDVAGWVVQSRLTRLEAPPVLFVAEENGVILRTGPQGAVLFAVPHGTPIISVIEYMADERGLTWANVLLPDGRRGWVAENLLDTTP